VPDAALQAPAPWGGRAPASDRGAGRRAQGFGSKKPGARGDFGGIGRIARAAGAPASVDRFRVSSGGSALAPGSPARS
jgi:hypothetical protein